MPARCETDDLMRDVALVVFDMAGTTIEDSGQVPDAFTAVLRANGIEISAAELNSLRGASKRDAIRHFVAAQGGAGMDARTDSIFAAFRAHLSGLFRSGGVKPMDGAASTFAWLRERGVKVALNTGFDRMITDLIVESVGWGAGAVDAVVCGDDVACGRPAPDLIYKAMRATGVADAARVMSVGDTVLDLQAGNNAGAGWVIGVLSGAHGRAQLETEPHTCLVESVAALPRLLEQYAIA
jgi:phosphonatase-like hydrolase